MIQEIRLIFNSNLIGNHFVIFSVQNLDIYIYKNSIKTSDIGLTARVGDSSTKFEIWYRKRKPCDTFTLQSMSEDIKQSWTEELSNLLWKQALRNRGIHSCSFYLYLYEIMNLFGKFLQLRQQSCRHFSFRAGFGSKTEGPVLVLDYTAFGLVRFFFFFSKIKKRVLGHNEKIEGLDRFWAV